MNYLGFCSSACGAAMVVLGSNWSVSGEVEKCGRGGRGLIRGA